MTLTEEDIEAIAQRTTQLLLERVMATQTSYNKAEACERLGITYKTLSRRKLRFVDGRVTEAEILRYLKEIGM